MAPPLETAPYMRQPLAPHQCQAYETLAGSIVQRTVEQYTKNVRNGPIEKSVDLTSWKLVKSRESIKIYKSRDRLQPNVFIEPLADAAPRIGLTRWAPHSTLLCVGTLQGSIEDAMYGSVTPTQLAMATRSAIIHDEFIYHRVLQDIRLPTVDEPFQYVGLKWGMRSSKVASIVKARDLVYVEATGFTTMSHEGRDERVGYMVYHSVDPSEVVSTVSKSAIRALYSMCALFRQKAAGVVELYITLTSDPGGSLPPKLAALSAANALIAASGVMECALSKKLAHQIKAKEDDIDRSTRVAVAKIRGSNWYCLQCARSLSTFNSLNACQVCSSTVCSRCISSRKLVVENGTGGVTLATFDVCNGCVSNTRKTDSTKAALEEFVLEQAQCSNPSNNWNEATVAFTSTSSTHQSSPTLVPDGPLSYISSSVGTPDDGDLLERTYFRPPRHHASLDSMRTVHSLDLMESSRSYSLPEWDVDARESDKLKPEDLEDDGIETIKPVPVRENPRELLLRQMNELRIQAERTYNYTKQQSLSFQQSPVEDDLIARHAKRALSRSAPSGAFV